MFFCGEMREYKIYYKTILSGCATQMGNNKFEVDQKVRKIILEALKRVENPLYNVSRHIAAAKRLKELCPAMKLVASGLTALQEYLPEAAEFILQNNYADFAGIGRMVLSYPQMPADVLAGKTLDRRRICRTFGECTNGPRHGMISGCFPLDEFYKKMPEAAKLRELKKLLNSK